MNHKKSFYERAMEERNTRKPLSSSRDMHTELLSQLVMHAFKNPVYPDTLPKVFSVICEYGEVSIKEIFEKLGITIKTIERTNKMVTEGSKKCYTIEIEHDIYKD